MNSIVAVCVHNNEIILAKILGGLSPHLQNIGEVLAPPATPPSYAPAQLLFTEQPSGQELNIVTSILIVQGFTEQPSGQELNIVTSAIIWIVQGFISEEFGSV